MTIDELIEDMTALGYTIVQDYMFVHDSVVFGEAVTEEHRDQIIEKTQGSMTDLEQFNCVKISTHRKSIRELKQGRK